MNCPKCGLQIDDDSKTCPYCGYAIQEIDLIKAEPKKETIIDDSQSNQSPHYDYPVRNEASGWWIFLGICFPLIGLILYFICISSRPSIARKVGLGAIIGGVINLVYFIIFISLFINYPLF